MGKKNLLKIPAHVSVALASIQGNYVVAGCVKPFSAEELLQGALSHLGVALGPGGLQLPKSIVPSAKQGKYSRRNVEGYAIIRKDLGMETRYTSVDSPDFGDWSRGSHTVELPYQTYPREHIAPEDTSIAMECPDRQPGRHKYVIKCELSEILDRRQKDGQVPLSV
jgi:hypothetical protein